MGSAFHQLCPRYSGTLTPLPLRLLGYGTPLPFTVLALCTLADDPLYFVLSFVIISQRISESLSGHDFHSQFFLGTFSIKNDGRVTVLILCKSSDDAL